MADDDDDDVAMDDGQEPEVTAADNGDARVATGGPITATIPVRKGTRPISDKVREVFAASLAKSAKRPSSGEDEGSLEPVDHDDLPTDAAPVAAVEPEPVVAAPVAPPPAVVAAPPPAAPQPPAPSLDPEVMRLRQEWQQKHEQLQADIAAAQQQSRTSDVAKLRDVYFDKGAPAVVDVIKQWMPGLEGEDLKKEVADLIQDLAHQYLEAPLDESVKDRITNKRVRVGLKTWKQEQELQEQERQKQLLASQQEQERLQVKRILHQEVTKSENASQYPWLASEDNAGEIVFETIEQELKQSGAQLTWQQAAQRVNDFLEKRSRAFYDKRSHLLSPKPQTASSEQQRAQGDKQVQQVTRAAQKPKQPEPPKAPLPEARLVSTKWTPEQHRQNTMSKFRGQLKAALQDDE